MSVTAYQVRRKMSLRRSFEELYLAILLALYLIHRKPGYSDSSVIPPVRRYAGCVVLLQAGLAVRDAAQWLNGPDTGEYWTAA